MNYAIWFLRIAIGIILVWFAVKNAQPVKLYGIGEQWWEAPLVFVLFIVFLGGVLIGLLAWVPTVVRQRREVGRLKKTLAQQPVAAAATPPAVPATTEPPHGI
jgi:lipopolysaccharide assembly protein A